VTDEDHTMAELIRSAANPLIKRVRLLADARHRRRAGAFVVHGVQPVWQAVEAGADIEVLVTAPDLLRRPAADMVAEAEQRGVPVARLSGELFTRISDRDGPAGLAAIVRGRTPGLQALESRQDSVFLALHQVGNPGNLGTIIRTASAAGCSGVVLIGATADPHDPAAVRASMGALFSVPVARAGSAEEFLAWCRGNGCTVAVTQARGADPLWGRLRSRPLAILFGAEAAGLPADLLGRGDLRLSIPMTGTADSLNLAVAAGIFAYEARRLAGHGPALRPAAADRRAAGAAGGAADDRPDGTTGQEGAT
jgi:TrmH family RNA methyltransferase